MPGRLPNHGFREGSGAAGQCSRFGQGFKEVPGGFRGRFRGIVSGTGFGEGFGASSGQGSKEVPASFDQGGSGASSGQGSNPVRR